MPPWSSPPTADRARQRRRRERQKQQQQQFKKPRVVPPVIPNTPANQTNSVPIIQPAQATPYVYTPAALPGMIAATPYAYPAVLPGAPAVATPGVAYRQIVQTPYGYAAVLPQTGPTVAPAATPAAMNYGLPHPAVPYVTPAATPYTLPGVVPVATPAAAPSVLLATPGAHYQWVPHPFPHPTVPAQQFFYSVPTTPLPWTPSQLQLVTGGLPAPGTAPNWTADQWKPQGKNFALSPWLAPNPRNASVPHVLWDVAIESPATMRRLTVRGLIVEFAGTPQFTDALAITPAQRSLIISVSPGCDTLWGPLTVSKEGGVKVGDVYWALHEYLQKQVTEGDVARIKGTAGGKERFRRMEYACWRRCMDGRGIAGPMANEGIKRVDFLEGSSVFWGMWCRRDANGDIYLCVGFCPPWM